MISTAEIDRESTVPDVFWAAGDPAFARRSNRPIRGKSRFMQGLVDVRGNLNYHLLMHRRLFLPDTSILFAPPLLKLLAKPDSGYQIFLTDGTIVPAMRASANSFADVGRQAIRGGNYAELSPRSIARFATQLDRAKPNILHTDSEGNQNLMNDLAEEALIQPKYWMDEIEMPMSRSQARDLVGFVKDSMGARGRKDFRQTEFWEYAEMLHTRGASDMAQMIRVELTIHSLGVMAKNFNLPLVVPSAYSKPAGRIFGTGTPVQEIDGSIELTPGSFPDDQILSSPEAVIYLLAKNLTPQQIHRIRKSKEHKRYIRSLEKADQDDVAAPGVLETALMIYMQDLTNLAGAAFEGRMIRLQIQQRASQWANVARWRAPAPVGLIARQLVHLKGIDPTVVGAAASMGTAAFVWMVDKITTSKLRKEETRAQIAQAVLRRSGTVKIQFFGPVSRKYWWLYGDEPVQ
ncbi:hypothetical protein [Nonomuraea sp. KM90]|uniref:hypothetical protein n=1 Tax=Nonomuraea sp. KM90 TaxID=3457428 RepID=UPI003FCE9419